MAAKTKKGKTMTKKMKQIRKNDLLRVREEFSDVGDTYPRKALEDEDGGRVLVVALDPYLPICSTERIPVYMLEFVQP